MPTRPGFARLLPLAVLTGLAAGTFALLASARGTSTPLPPAVPLGISHSLPARCDGSCSDVAVRFPSFGVVDADGRAWGLDEIPGHTLRGLHLRNADWSGIDLHGADFIGCDFRGCDLTGASLQGASFECCDLRGARLDGADLTGALSYVTHWPGGLTTPAERRERAMVEGVGP